MHGKEKDWLRALPAYQQACHLVRDSGEFKFDASGTPYNVKEQQAEEARNKRRIGLGVTGLADALLMMGLRYGSEEAAAKTEDWLIETCSTLGRSPSAGAVGAGVGLRLACATGATDSGAMASPQHRKRRRRTRGLAGRAPPR